MNEPAQRSVYGSQKSTTTSAGGRIKSNRIETNRIESRRIKSKPMEWQRQSGGIISIFMVLAVRRQINRWMDGWMDAGHRHSPRHPYPLDHQPVRQGSLRPSKTHTDTIPHPHLDPHGHGESLQIKRKLK